MKMALALARRGLGRTWPNPSVGCVITDQKGHIVGRGVTGPGGRPHAEAVALSQAGNAARGGVAYVTLEPCAHHGKTPPCAASLARAGISRVVIATGDPDRRVSGRGMDILKNAAIQVDFGICQDEADEVNQGYFTLCHQKRPMVTLKMATSRDGMIAAPSGGKKWITGPLSRQRGHLLRANHDAILVGIGTVLADNPSLDCRLAGLSHLSPVRIVLDSHLRIPDDCRLVNTAKKIPTWVITGHNEGQKYQILKNKGVEIFHCKMTEDGRMDLNDMMITLGNQGITRLLSEGGAEVNASLIRTSLVDRLYWFKATETIGADGLAALSFTDINKLTESPNFSLVRSGHAGNDIWQEYEIGH